MALILVHTAHPQAVEHAGPGFGRLLSPRQFSRVADTADSGIPWAADNDCYQGLNAGRFAAMLQAIHCLPGCLFVTVPDVVENWRETRRLFDKWVGRVALTYLPPAYVIQDGQPASEIPWDDIGCLFVGGSTNYKLSIEAERLAREAKRRGLWVHVGRVNSRKRYDYARAIGADSIDGTQFSMFRDTKLPNGLTWHRQHLQERIPL